MRPRQPRRSSAAAQIGPPRRVLTLSNVSHQSGVVGVAGVAGIGGIGVGLGGSSGAMLQHKPNYRHVSAGTLFKCVQEGLDFDKTIEGIQEESEAEAAAVASGSGSRGGIHSHRREQHPGSGTFTFLPTRVCSTLVDWRYMRRGGTLFFPNHLSVRKGVS